MPCRGGMKRTVSFICSLVVDEVRLEWNQCFVPSSDTWHLLQTARQ